MEELVYGIIVTSKEALSGVAGNPIVTRQGEQFWVVSAEWCPSSSSLELYKEPPGDVLVFKQVADAESFARKWKGHPWWCQPISFEVVPLKPKMIQRGWTLCTKKQ